MPSPGLAFDDRSGQIWLDGALVDWRDARLHILSHGLHYASAVFEGERAYGGEIFALRAHTERLFASAKMLDMVIPYTADEIDEACKQVLQAQGLKDAYVRPIAWRGAEMMGVAAQHTQTHLAIAAWDDWASYFDPAEKMKGIRLELARWRRPSPESAPVGCKGSSLYAICTLAKHEAEAHGYADGLMLDYRGLVAETTGANIFLVKDGVMHTPEPDCFLDGITRRAVIKLAAAQQIKTITRFIKPEELGDFDECFLTGTAAEVTPVSQIGEHSYTPGRITGQLSDDYSALARGRKR